MPYVITTDCRDTKDRACVAVCPVNCIYEGPEQLYIHPDECIDCGACEPECPVTAIYAEEDVPPHLRDAITTNREIFSSAQPPTAPQV
jgi:NAD-dependent dihydropyrimidine dehydrogenase PreA subunit